MIWTDRSRIEEYKRCQRARYLGYELDGRGYTRKALSIPLITGGSVHDPLAWVLTAAREGGLDRAQTVVGSAVKLAQQKYIAEVQERGLLSDAFDGNDEQVGQVLTDPLGWQVNEQIAMIEALVKGWTRMRLPTLLAEYEIIDVEAEQNVELGEDVVLMTRRDALLRRRATGEYFVLNFKTTSNPDKTWLEQWRYDMQTMSEFIAAQKSVDELNTGTEHVVRGVLIEGLVKGQRRIKWPEEADPIQWRHSSPLLYHYVTPDNPPLPRSYNATGYWRCSDEHDWRWVKGGKCPGGKTHTVSKEYQRDMVTQTCGFDQWLDWLVENDPETLTAQFVSVPAILRSEHEIEEWKVATVEQEQEVAAKAQLARLDGDLRTLFPKHAGSNCLRPSRCQFLEACWGAVDFSDESMWIPRQANHPQEHALKGWTKLEVLK